MKFISILLAVVCMSAGAQAQEWGLAAGVHNGTAEIDGATDKAVLSWRAGLLMGYEIADTVKLRSGLMYTNRYSEFEATPDNLELQYSYLDVPVLFQFQMNEMIGLFVGPVVAINVGKKMEQGSASADDDDIKSLYLLAQAGVSFTFDMMGFDLYYERGLGEMSDDFAENYSAYGANFVFWF